MWTDMKQAMQDVEIVHNDLCSVQNHKTDVAKLESYFLEKFMTNFKNMSSFNKYFTFGTQSVSKTLTAN